MDEKTAVQMICEAHGLPPLTPWQLYLIGAISDPEALRARERTIGYGYSPLRSLYPMWVAYRWPSRGQL